ncbi:MAG TPA: Gldg family protein [Polyangiaceae bacterium]|nr:Gldg family protein [Polyangiaceae bacterium]
MATEDQKKKAAAQTGLYVLVIVAIVVIANMLSAKVYKRADVTQAERFTLSQGSGRLLSTLKQPIQVDAYVKTGLPQLDAFVADLTDLLKEYEHAGKGKFKFTLIEANTDELRSQAKEAGLQEQPFVDPSQTSEDQAAVAQGYMGLVFKYESEKTVIPFLSPQSQDGLEFWITNKIREIRDKADDIKHRIGVITDKDELKLDDQNLVPKQGKQGSPTMKSIMEQNFPFYKMEEVKLSESAPIDKDLVGLIITQPRKDYTERELRRIDEFMLRGGKALVVYASAVTLKPQDATMSATLDTHNLDKLLSGYGIQMNKDAVLDFGAQFRLPVRTQSGVGWIRDPGIIHVVNDSRLGDDERSIDNSFPPFFRLEELAFPFASSLKILRDKQPSDVKLAAVARSTPQSSVDKGPTVDMRLRLDWSPKPPQESRVIAAYAQGKLKSAFAGGTAEPGITVPDRAPTDSRVLVVSSSLFLTNPFAYAGNGPDLGGQFAMFGNVGGDENLLRIAQPYVEYLTNTIISFKNTLDWLSGDSDLVAASAKLIGDPHLVYADVAKPKFKSEDDPAEIKRKDEDYRNSRKSLQRNVQWTLTLGIPLLFGAFGLFRWRRRESMRAELKV